MRGGRLFPTNFKGQVGVAVPVWAITIKEMNQDGLRRSSRERTKWEKVSASCFALPCDNPFRGVGGKMGSFLTGMHYRRDFLRLCEFALAVLSGRIT
jgi:hypothetical protein